jgi:diguanylate cyclase (GGDEF)-like protein
VLLHGVVTERTVDPVGLFLALVWGGVIVLAGAGWLLGRKDDQLAARNRELQAMTERLQALSATDALTGIPNRRSFDERLAVEMARTARYHTPLALVMVDLDHFKQLNDGYGHPAGDQVLRRIAELLEGEKRLGDMVARYGGEEFVAILPHSDAAAALAWAERARARIADTTFELSGRRVPVTASFGVAAAMSALYEAKAAGRNRVTLAPSRDQHPTWRYGAVK